MELVIKFSSMVEWEQFTEKTFQNFLEKYNEKECGDRLSSLELAFIDTVNRATRIPNYDLTKYKLEVGAVEFTFKQLAFMRLHQLGENEIN